LTVALVTVVGAVRHVIVVPDVQDAVSHLTPLSVTVVVVSMRAKEKPFTVELRPPDGGALPLPTRTELTAGASKVKLERSVPMAAANMTVVLASTAKLAGAMRHCTTVPVVHAVVAQSAWLNVALGVESLGAKARPLTVAVRPPDAGTLPLLTSTKETAGESKVKLDPKVPTRLAAVTIVVASLDVEAEDIRHATVVPLIHAAVAQSTLLVVAVGVRLTDAKPSPPSVALKPPVGGALPFPTSTKETSGASNVK
jgi:hypothetical protein